MKNYICSAFIILAVLLSSCERDIDFKGSYDGEKLVLFACVNPDTVITASVYNSTFVLSKTPEQGRVFHRNAKVTAEIDGVEHPLHFDYEAGKFVCSVKPSVGSKVIVKASEEGYKTVQGETVIPQRPKASFRIGQIETEHFEDGSTKCWNVHLKIDIQGASNDVNYLRLNAFKKITLPGDPVYGTLDPVIWRKGDLLTRDLSFFDSDVASSIEDIGDTDTSTIIPDCFDDGRFIKGQPLDVWMVIYPEGILSSGSNGGQGEEKPVAFDESDFEIEVQSLSQSMYRYLVSRRKYYEAEDSLGDVFGEPVAVSNNIKNGIGCVGAVASTIASY